MVRTLNTGTRLILSKLFDDYKLFVHDPTENLRRWGFLFFSFCLFVFILFYCRNCQMYYKIVTKREQNRMTIAALRKTNTLVHNANFISRH